MAITAGVIGVAALAGSTAMQIKNTNQAKHEADDLATGQANAASDAQKQMQQQQDQNEQGALNQALTQSKAARQAGSQGYGGTILTGLNATPGSGAAASGGGKTLLGM